MKESEQDENKVDESPKFLVNKDGFPLSENTVEVLWKNVRQIHTEGDMYEKEIRGNPNLPKAALPVAPSFNLMMSTKEKLESIQNYMRALQYNHTGLQFFEVKKYRPLSGLMEVAKEIIRESLPIKCLEAVILSLYLTSGMNDIVRFTISFKSKFVSNVHRHVVLGLNHGVCYGALGMSRRKELMDKPLAYQSLGNLILNYKKAYEHCHHKLKRVKLSLPVAHDVHSCERISWKYFNLPVSKMTDVEIKDALDKYSRVLKKL